MQRVVLSRPDGSLTEALCTRCGLCCDGSLFADVELAGRDEAAALEVMGLRLDEDDPDQELLLQPCAALRGTTCRIYPHRPECCRTFACRLLQKAQAGRVSAAQAQAQIVAVLRLKARIDELIGELWGRKSRLPWKERAAAALRCSEESFAGAGNETKRTELRTALVTFESLIQRTFLNR